MFTRWLLQTSSLDFRFADGGGDDRQAGRSVMSLNRSGQTQDLDGAQAANRLRPWSGQDLVGLVAVVVAGFAGAELAALEIGRMNRGPACAERSCPG